MQQSSAPVVHLSLDRQVRYRVRMDGLLYGPPLQACEIKVFNHYMKREDQQDATIRYLLLTSVSTCFGHHYAHLQEIKGPVNAFGALFWFCWMSLVAVVGRCLVGCEHCEDVYY